MSKKKEAARAECVEICIHREAPQYISVCTNLIYVNSVTETLFKYNVLDVERSWYFYFFAVSKTYKSVTLAPSYDAF